MKTKTNSAVATQNGSQPMRIERIDKAQDERGDETNESLRVTDVEAGAEAAGLHRAAHQDEGAHRERGAERDRHEAGDRHRVDLADLEPVHRHAAVEHGKTQRQEHDAGEEVGTGRRGAGGRVRFSAHARGRLQVGVMGVGRNAAGTAMPPPRLSVPRDAVIRPGR